MAGPSDVYQRDWLAEYPPPRSLPLDQEALRIYERAYYVGLKSEKPGTPPVSFTTVLIALLAGEDETSRWFAQLARSNGPDPQAVLAEKNMDEGTVRSLALSSGRPKDVQLSTDKHLLTASARAVIGNAEAWAQRVGASDIGVRHLVAAYVLNPPVDHSAQMQRWNFQESKWRPAFFDWVAERYTAEQWTDASQRPAPTNAMPAFAQQEIKGADIAFPGDPSMLAVLERAAVYHARIQERSQEQSLLLKTVLFALIDTAYDDVAVRTAIPPVWNAIAAVEVQYQAGRDAFLPPSAAPAAASFSEINIGPRVLNVLETARDLASVTQQDADGELRVGVLQLAGALVSRRVDGDEDLATLGLAPQQLRLDLIEYAQQQGAPVEVWREALGEEETLQAGRPVELNSDEPEAVVRLDEEWKSDPLAIRPDVESFAALLASKSLEPPLSIGLFGPWGSGKTTFLKRLRRAVEHRAAEARTANAAAQPTDYVANVVHVDFNAWHFAESALTSSLVDTILRALSAYIKDDIQVAGKAWREQKLAALETTKRKLAAAEAVEAAARAAVANAEKQTAAARQKAEEQSSALQDAVKVVWQATTAQLRDSKVVKDSGVLEAVGDTIQSSEELQARLNALRRRPAPILHDLGWLLTLLFAGLVIAVPPLVGWLVDTVLAGGQASQFLASMTAMLATIGVWARAATGAAAKVDMAIAEVDEEYTRRVAADPAVQKAQADLAAAQASAATAAASLQAAQQELARAQAEAANATIPAQMLQLVSSRIEEQSYNKELTTLSLARADLEALSLLLRDQQDDTTAPNGAAPGATPSTAAVRAVDRVILYIDDLDRCKPRDVVRVLQLVHMLLAFELFVVVVAVDARWVEESLRDSYRWLAGSDAGAPADPAADGAARPPGGAGRVTPQDYLEKIFQISFWLEPMTATRAASYLASLVRPPHGPADVQATPGGAAAQANADGQAHSSIGIDTVELDYMRALARFLGPSPRRVKRLVNAYRLIKARMSDAQLSTFVADRKAEDGSVRAGPYQIVIALLVIGTGAPAASAQILQELAEWDPQDSVGEVVDHWKARNQPDWMMAAQVVEMLMQTQNAKDVAELRGWARKVRRYLLSAQSADLQLGGIRPATVAVAAAVAANETGNETANGTVAETQAPEDSRGGALPGGRGTSWR